MLSEITTTDLYHIQDMIKNFFQFQHPRKTHISLKDYLFVYVDKYKLTDGEYARLLDQCIPSIKVKGIYQHPHNHPHLRSHI